MLVDHFFFVFEILINTQPLRELAPKKSDKCETVSHFRGGGAGGGLDWVPVSHFISLKSVQIFF